MSTAEQNISPANSGRRRPRSVSPDLNMNHIAQLYRILKVLKDCDLLMLIKRFLFYPFFPAISYM